MVLPLGQVSLIWGTSVGRAVHELQIILILASVCNQPLNTLCC